MKPSVTCCLVLIFIFGPFSFGYSQSLNWDWAKGGGGSERDLFTGVTTDNSGNVYTVGWFRSASLVIGSTTLIRKGYSDVVIAKYDSTGKVIWAKSFGGPEEEFGTCITTDLTGNIYVGGYYYSDTVDFGVKKLTTYYPGRSAIFILKMNSAGKVLWVQNAGGNSDDEVSAIKCNANGDVFFCGEFRSQTLYVGGSPELSHQGNGDAYLIKLNSAGKVAWSKSAGGTERDVAYSLDMDNYGFIYITGGFSSSDFRVFGTTPWLASKGGFDIFLIRIDTNTLASKLAVFGGADDDRGKTILQQNGKLYISGEFKSAGLKLGTTTLSSSNASFDIFRACTDTGFNFNWVNQTGGSSDEFVNSGCLDKNGNIYLAGSFMSPSLKIGTTNLTNAGYSDVYIAKFDTFGVPLWAKSTGGANFDVAESVISDNYGNLFVCGDYISSKISFGSASFSNVGATYQDYFLARLSTKYVSTEEIISPAIMKSWPNPVENTLWVNLGAEYSSPYTIEIIDILGRNQRIVNSSLNQIEVDVQSLKAGIYLLRLSGQAGGVTRVLKFEKR